ncbi:ABC transporter substrate-binding protein [Acidisoma cellulosilytica]|uniref:ABC transporter substrate-binding protein n=1 Tax=Acidisoma cellulosilyticum TaxID=2802395 RepID=A0A963Z568_9PROT|nr:ABC transporter substrate-binding protein [Acidisoma cellulosilyticum]MCB8882849.1 ABC transporter substrate-binding protein [Acidisoma cellulosilyticum]
MAKTPFPDAIRRQASDIQNHILDEYVARRLDRRQFLRHASIMGMIPLLGGLPILGASAARAADAAPGGDIRVALTTPAGAVDPVTSADAAGATLLQQSGEFLVMDDPDLTLRPALATAWSANADATIWTFTLRRNVTFHSGKAFTADDVVATMDRLADPKVASNALSVFQGVLSKGNTHRVDDYTVAFHLDAPNGNFPYYVSSDNYNAIILPASYAGGYEKTFDGTGPFKLDRYTPKVGASFVRSDAYWGPKALPDRVDFTFYDDQQSQILAMQAGGVDVVAQFSVQGGQALLNNPAVSVIALRSSAHNQVHMRCDMDPFKDKRVRRAMALTLNRTGLVKGLFRGESDIGNDSPFAPVFPSTNPSIPQRQQDLNEAKQLLEAAGVKPGTEVNLTTEQFIEIPGYAVLLQDWAKAIGIKINLKIETQSAYYGNATFGQSDWLDVQMGITDYAHRGVPNVLLAAPLLSNGAWNAAHFKNPDYDRLVGQFVGAVDLQTQRDISGKIETLLLDETPIIFGYFYKFLTATSTKLAGVRSAATSQLFLDRAHFV